MEFYLLTKTIKDDKQDGNYKMYNENGTLSFFQNYKDDKLL